MNSPVSLLSGIYPLPAMHSLLVTSYLSPVNASFCIPKSLSTNYSNFWASMDKMEIKRNYCPKE